MEIYTDLENIPEEQSSDVTPLEAEEIATMSEPSFIETGGGSNQNVTITTDGVKKTVTVTDPYGSQSADIVPTSAASDSSVVLSGEAVYWDDSFGNNEILVDDAALINAYNNMFADLRSLEVGDFYYNESQRYLFRCTDSGEGDYSQSEWEKVFQFPTTETAGQVLQSDGKGGAFWADSASGGSGDFEVKTIFIPADSLDIFPNMIGNQDVYFGLFNLPHTATGAFPGTIYDTSTILNVEILIDTDNGVESYHLARLIYDGLIDSLSHITQFSRFPDPTDVANGNLPSFPLLYIGPAMGGSDNVLASIAEGNDPNRTILGVNVSYI